MSAVTPIQPAEPTADGFGALHLRMREALLVVHCARMALERDETDAADAALRLAHDELHAVMNALDEWHVAHVCTAKPSKPSA